MAAFTCYHKEGLQVRISSVIDSFSLFIPILNGGGGGGVRVVGFDLKCNFCLKSPESRYIGGIK